MRANSRGAAALARRRSLAIRHVSGHRLIALIEIVSSANKDRTRHIEEFVDKAVSARSGHSFVAGGPVSAWSARPFRNPWRCILVPDSGEPYAYRYDAVDAGQYVAEPRVDIYLEHLVSACSGGMPLFLRPDRIVNCR